MNDDFMVRSIVRITEGQGKDTFRGEQHPYRVALLSCGHASNLPGVGAVIAGVLQDTLSVGDTRACFKCARGEFNKRSAEYEASKAVVKGLKG